MASRKRLELACLQQFVRFGLLTVFGPSDTAGGLLSMQSAAVSPPRSSSDHTDTGEGRLLVLRRVRSFAAVVVVVTVVVASVRLDIVP